MGVSPPRRLLLKAHEASAQGILAVMPEREVMVMMGTKARLFAPIAVVSLEDLVPSNHFYRHLDHVLDLSCVRDLVKETYAHGGRPSIDPVVFFKLQLVMFFEDIRSERLLMQLVADKLSVRWYVGYNLDEPLPDHSSLTRIRERYGVEVFRRFFARDCRAVPSRRAGVGPRAVFRWHQGPS